MVQVIFRAVSVPSEGNVVVYCVHEYKNPANVKSGQRSQEITFDFVSAEAGIYRQAQTIPGHRYRIEAWGKHVQSVSPVELSLGVDLAGGVDWQALSVTWYPWDETEEDAWVHTEITVQASGNTLTVFLRGYHPYAVQGGATLFDNVRVVDLRSQEGAVLIDCRGIWVGVPCSSPLKLPFNSTYGRMKGDVAPLRSK